MTQDKLSELRALRTRLAALETEIATEAVGQAQWAPKSYYTMYHLMAGMVLGLIGGAASLMLNIIGAAMVGKHPLELIRVYLTFPMGEEALTVDSGFALAAGCCLYLGTGMIGGIPFHMILSRFFDKAGAVQRFAVASALGVGIWLINFYGILSWLQPLIVEDGRAWIVELVPIYVAVLTHLAYGWTLLLVDRWGQFVPPVATADAQRVMATAQPTG